MVYRIRYREAGKPDKAEMVVEANSPTEAIVKFRHLYPGRRQDDLKHEITGICPERCHNETPW